MMKLPILSHWGLSQNEMVRELLFEIDPIVFRVQCDQFELFDILREHLEQHQVLLMYYNLADPFWCSQPQV